MRFVNWRIAALIAIAIALLIRQLTRQSVECDIEWLPGSDEQASAQFGLNVLEQGRYFDPKTRQLLVLQLIEQGLLPGATPEHGVPERFDELVAMMKRKALADTSDDQ